MATHLSPHSATIKWQTSTPASSIVEFGLDTHYGGQAADTKLVTSHSVVLAAKFLLPGKVYHYIVKSVDANGNVGVSTDQNFIAATPVAKKSSGNHTLILIGGAAVLLVATTAGFSLLRRMQRRSQDLNSHFLMGDPLQGTVAQPNKKAGPSQPTETIITPQGTSTTPQPPSDPTPPNKTIGK